MENYSILIVDDDRDIREVVGILLETNGYIAESAEDSDTAINILKSGKHFDLLILDIMMPGMNGIEACKEIRKFSNIPTLFLTAKTREQDMREAYLSGGDDFLIKPFSQNELLLKVSSLVRRYRVYSESPEAKIACGITLDDSTRNAVKNGVKIELTDKEYDILKYFFINRGKPMDSEELYINVWNEKYLPSASNTIMVHILNLRRKLEDDPSQPRIIKTVWGKGYQVD